MWSSESIQGVMHWLTADDMLKALVAAVILGAVIWVSRKTWRWLVDQAAARIEGLYRRRIRSLLDQYVRDLKIHDKPIEIAFWFAPLVVTVVLLLGTSVWMLLFAAFDRGFVLLSVFSLVAAWILGMAGTDRLQRLRDMDRHEKEVQARINRLVKKRGVDDEIRRWWNEAFHEPFDQQ